MAALSPSEPKSPKGMGQRSPRAGGGTLASPRGFRTSPRSPRSPRYRTLDRSGSHVDESLFDAPSPRSPRMLKLSDVHSRFPPEEYSIVTSRDYDKFKNSVISKSEEKAKNESLERQLVARASMERAQARKELLRIYDEQRDNSKVGMSEFEKERMEAGNALIKRAQSLLDEQLDEVKAMNSMMVYAKCAAVRDAQKIEKSYLEQQKREEERAKDMEVEIRRLKALKEYEDREQERVRKRKEGARVIEEQIRLREEERLRQLDQDDLEKEVMSKYIDKIKTQDAEEQRNRYEKQKRFYDQAIRFNDEQVKRKKEEAAKEKRDDYERAEAIRLAAIEDQKKRVQMEIERRRRETELIEAMEKAAGKEQQKIEELERLREKRSMEGYERQWRERTKREAARQAAILDDVKRVRELQLKEKHQRMVESTNIQRAEFERVKQVHLDKEKIEREKEIAERLRKREHLSGLVQQIEEKAQARAQGRREYLAEGNVFNQRFEKEKARLKAIKEQKLAQLKADGVPERYLAELEMMKI